ncbi:periplasmic heavy metal sensor [Sneathiella sp.]|uniref:periplasmic heavy metal sensor n=1 Tax=Sneathiella sp. TaxID=1964365 RepID=UPI0035691BAD
MTMSKSRILSLALIVSLAVNVIIGGFIATQWIDYGMGKKHHGGYHFDRRAAVATLGDKEKGEFQEIWDTRRDLLRPYFRDYGQNRQKLAELFSADTLNLAEIEATFSSMIDTQMQIEKLLHVTLLEIAKTLPPDHREAFFKEGYRSLKKHRKADKDRQE